MKRLLEGSLVLVLGVVLGRMFDGVTTTATAGAGTGGGVTICASQNGDVNADESVNISDALTLLNHLFVGAPEVLAPLCALPPKLLPPGQTDGRFIDNGDGTIIDTATGLMWQQAYSPLKYQWEEAGVYCADLDLGGHDDWRLPNVRELESLVNYDKGNEMLDVVFQTNGEDQCWTATTCAGYVNFAHVANFHSALESIITNRQKNAIEFHVRAVRNVSSPD